MGPYKLFKIRMSLLYTMCHIQYAVYFRYTLQNDYFLILND